MQQVRLGINWQTGRHSVIRLKVVNSTALKLSWHDYCQQLSSSNLCCSRSDASNRGWLWGGWRQEEVDVRVLHLQQLAEQLQVHDVPGQQASVRDWEHLQRCEQQQQPERWVLMWDRLSLDSYLCICIAPRLWSDQSLSGVTSSYLATCDTTIGLRSVDNAQPQ